MDSLKKRFINGIYKIGVGNVALNISGLIIIMLATRYFSVRDIGIYVIFDLICGILEAVGGLGIRLSIVKFLVETNNHDEKRVLILTCTIYIFLSTVLLAILTIICNKIFGFFPTNTIALLFACYFIFRSLFQYINMCVFQGLQCYGYISKSYLLHSISKIILVFMALVVINGDFNVFLLAVTTSFFLPLIMQIWLLHINIHLGFRFDQNIFKKILHFSFPLYLNNIVMLFYHRGYTMLLALLLDTTAVAYYNIAMKIPNMLNTFQTVYLTVFFPTIIECLKNKKEKAVLLLRSSILAIFAIIIPLSFVFYFFSEKIITLLFSEKYAVTALASFILLFRAAFTLSGPLMGNTLIALGYTKAPLQINIFLIIIGISISCILIPIYNFWGVVYTGLTVSILGFFTNYIYLKSKIFSLHIEGQLILAITVFLLFIVNICFWKIAIMNIFFYAAILLAEGLILYALIVPIDYINIAKILKLPING